MLVLTSHPMLKLLKPALARFSREVKGSAATRLPAAQDFVFGVEDWGLGHETKL